MKAKVVSYAGFTPTDLAASSVGRANQGSDSRPELILRRALWGRGLRYRLRCVDVRGRLDIVFVKRRVAVFCDGDFWHGRDWRRRSSALAKGSNAGIGFPRFAATLCVTGE